MRSLCRALLTLNVLYCALAALQPGLPGWHMFESVEPLDHTLTDRDGVAVDVFQALPRGANLVDRGELRRVIEHVCRTNLARGPFRYAEPAWRDAPLVLGQDGDPTMCRVHVHR